MSNRVRTHPRRFGECPGMKSRGTTVFHHAEYQPLNAFQSQAIYCEGLANQREGGYLRPPLLELDARRGLRSGSCVSEVLTAFVASLATQIGRASCRATG